MDAFPELRCVLQHWYEFRLPGEKLGTVNTRRLVDIKAMHMVARQQGVDALHATIIGAVRNRRVVEPAALPIGAALCNDSVHVETFVRQALNAQHVEHRIAAAFGAIYFLRRSEEVAFILSERVVVADEDTPTVQAARLALDIWTETKDGGKCSRCGLTGGLLSIRKQRDWVPLLGSSKLQ